MPRFLAQGADIRTDVPAYRIYRNGVAEDEVSDIVEHWSDDAVLFLFGCSFTFEDALKLAGVPIRHRELGCTVPMYGTTLECRPAGPFNGRMVVSMRPVACAKVSRVVQITARFPAAHGSPVHIGKPSLIGIDDLGRSDYGDPVPIEDDELPVLWACGVMPQSLVLDSQPTWMITHSPGRMFVN